MPFLQVNAGKDGPCLHSSTQPLQPRLEAALRAPGPVIIMTHGFKFAPGDGLDCPHQHILSPTPRNPSWKAVSWPQGLGLNIPQECHRGLGIAFGWAGRGTIWQAYKQAGHAGRALANLIGMIHHIAPGKPIHLIAHSLGARVVLSALHDLPAHSISRAILLCGAEYVDTAVSALNAPAGRTADIINVTTRENDLFDFLMECLIPSPPYGNNRCLGRGLPDRPNTLNLQLDHPATLARLSQAGYRIAPAKTRICHWSSYLRPGVFQFYRDMLFGSHLWPMQELQATLPYRPDPHWTRLRSLVPHGSTIPQGDTPALS